MILRRQVLLLGALGPLGCGRAESSSKAATSSGSAAPGAVKIVSLNGAGATLPYPLYSKWMAEYNRLHPSVRINYQSIGSGGGIRQVVAGTVDFGATDAPMKDVEAKAAAGRLTHIPTTIGSVVVSYNSSGLTTPLRLTSGTLARIYLGEVTRWNDPAIVASNPGVHLPAQPLTVVFRTDGSGTTAVFTEFLAKASPTFEHRVGVGKSVRWPAGLGAKGNEGVTGQVKGTPGAMGYIERAYATQSKLRCAEVENGAGRFVAPTLDAITAAADSVEMPDELHVSLTGAGGDAYPIASYTYLLVYDDAQNAAKAEALARFVWWAVHEGQAYARALDYAPLPAKVVGKVESRLKQLRAGGRRLLDGV